MRRSLTYGMLCLSVLAACGEGSATGPDGRPLGVCQPSRVENPGPVTDPQGPFFHQVAVATTADGLTLTGAQEVLTSASVPDGTQLPDGGVAIYYNNGATGTLDVARLSNGVATPMGSIALDGIRPVGGADPEALLVNGKVRLFFLVSGTGTFCAAESSDGLNFTSLGVAAAVGTRYTDPTVTQLPDGSWLMAYSQIQMSVFARSSDGISFTPTGARVQFGGIPELTTLADGRVRLYVCSAGQDPGIHAYVSSNGGNTWEHEARVLPPGTLGHSTVCDPSVVRGTNIFVFKTAN